MSAAWPRLPTVDGMSLRALVLRNTGYQFAAQAVSAILGLATAAVLSRYLGVERFGWFSYLFAFFYFFLCINDFGVPVVVIREVSQRRDRAAEIIGAMLSFKLVLAVLCVAAAWGTIWLVGYPPELRNALLIYSLVLPVSAFQLPTVMFQVLLALEYPSLIGTINRLVTFVLTMGAVLMGAGVAGLAAALLAGEVIGLVTLLAGARRLVRPAWRWDPQFWWRVLRSSLPLGVTALCVAIINRADFIMLERMTDARQVGLYAAAYKVTTVLEALPIMFMATVYPLMARYAVESRERLWELFRASVVLLGSTGVLLGLAVWALAPAIIRVLFGPEYAGADSALRVLIWATVFLYTAICGGNLLISMGHERVNLGVNMVAAALNVLLNVLFIPRWGYVGAAGATALTYLFVLAAIMTGAWLALAGGPPVARPRPAVAPVPQPHEGP